MLLQTLFEKAEEIEVEDDFNLSPSDIVEIRSLTDVQLASLLMSLRSQKIHTQELVKVSDPSVSWISFKLSSNSYRTRFHSFLTFLMYKNPILVPTLTKIIDKI